MNLPPWARQIQQSPVFQVVVAAILFAGPTFLQCAGTDLSQLSIGCFKLGGLAAGTYIWGIIQHSPGSPAFNPNGTDNQQVAEVVAADKAAQPVAVVPVASPAAREEIRATVKDAAVKAVVVAPAPAVVARP